MQRHDSERVASEDQTHMGNSDLGCGLCPDPPQPVAGNSGIRFRNTFRICLLQDGVSEAYHADALRQQHIVCCHRQDGDVQGGRQLHGCFQHRLVHLIMRPLHRHGHLFLLQDTFHHHSFRTEERMHASEIRGRNRRQD